eukprot:scaffold61523_cov40-Phaeocystis_antarctica.AAC.1
MHQLAPVLWLLYLRGCGAHGPVEGGGGELGERDAQLRWYYQLTDALRGLRKRGRIDATISTNRFGDVARRQTCPAARSFVPEASR